MSENARNQEDMRIILNVALTAKFEENFVWDEMVDDDVNQADGGLEEAPAAPKKRKPGPLMASTRDEVSQLFGRNRARAESKLKTGDAQVAKLL